MTTNGVTVADIEKDSLKGERPSHGTCDRKREMAAHFSRLHAAVVDDEDVTRAFFFMVLLPRIALRRTLLNSSMLPIFRCHGRRKDLVNLNFVGSG